MIEEEFETWPTDLIPDTIHLAVDIYVINLNYLENKFPRFMELSNSGTEKSNKMLVGLDTATMIPDNDDDHLLILIDLEVE